MQCAEMFADLYDFRKKSDTKNKIIRSKYFRNKKNNSDKASEYGFTAYSIPYSSPYDEVKAWIELGFSFQILKTIFQELFLMTM